MLYVADTHSLIWFLTNDAKLGKKAKGIFDKADSGKAIIIIPTIVLAELIFICEKKNAGIEFKNILNKINQSSNYIFYNLNIKTVLEIANLPLIPEMHDRIVTATARLNKAILITKDKKIVNSKIVKTLW